MNTVDTPAQFVFIIGNKLYTANGKIIRMYDISKKYNPVEKGSTTLKGSVTDIVYINGVYKLVLSNGQTYSIT